MSQRVYRRFTKIEQGELWKRWHHGSCRSGGSVAGDELARPIEVCYLFRVERHSFEPGRIVRTLVAAGSTSNRWRAMKATAYLLASDAREAEDKIRSLNAKCIASAELGPKWGLS